MVGRLLVFKRPAARDEPKGNGAANVSRSSTRRIIGEENANIQGEFLQAEKSVFSKLAKSNNFVAASLLALFLRLFPLCQ